MFVSTHGITARPTSAPAFTGILDTYTGADVAYSAARRLATAYTGALIRVRRSSDNTEQDIGYDSNNVLDESALTSFVGANNGFVTTWYDQSGNGRNAINTTAINQPRIVNAGVVEKQNSQPILYFDSTDFLVLAVNLDYSGVDSSFFMTYKKTTTANNAVFLGAGGNYMWLNYGSNQYYGNTSVSDADFNIANEFMLVSATMDYNVRLKWYKNNILQQTVTSGFAGPIYFQIILGRTFTSVPTYSNELIIYPSDQDANANGINTNINTFYSLP